MADRSPRCHCTAWARAPGAGPAAGGAVSPLAAGGAATDEGESGVGEGFCPGTGRRGNDGFREARDRSASLAVKMRMNVLTLAGPFEVRNATDRARDPGEADLHQPKEVSVGRGGVAPSVTQQAYPIRVGNRLGRVLQQAEKLHPRLSNAKSGLGESSASCGFRPGWVDRGCHARSLHSVRSKGEAQSLLDGAGRHMRAFRLHEGIYRILPNVRL